MRKGLLYLIGFIVLLAGVLLVIKNKEVFQSESEQEKQHKFIEAIENDQVEVLNPYIKKGLNLNFLSEEGYTPLETALNYHALQAVEVLLANKAPFNEDSPESLMIRIVSTMDDYNLQQDNENYDELIASYKFLLQLASEYEGTDFKAIDPSGNSALHLAAAKGFPEIIQYLVENGANISAENDAHETPLLLAVKAGQLKAVEQLYEYYHEDPHIDSEGNTLLISATLNGRMDVLEFLLEKNQAEINHVNVEGKTALIIAAEYGYREIVDILLKRGADSTISSLEGKTALQYASEWNHDEIVELLK